MLINNNQSEKPLTSEQIAFFKDNGYLLLPGALDVDLCTWARDRLWEALPTDCSLRRHEPQTHVGPFSTADINKDLEHRREGFKWQLRSIRTDPKFIQLIYSPKLCAVAEQLLGKNNVRQPVAGELPGVRGIYCTLPYGDQAREPDEAHTDAHPFHFGAVGLIHDVPPDGGAFKVWPKSHKRLYPTFWMQYDQARVPSYEHLPSLRGITNPPEYHAELARIEKDTEPVECWGKAGDVVLWHHRLAHMASHNYSGVIRQAVLGDFARNDLDQTRLDPPQPNMWRDWSDELKESNGGYCHELASTQRLRT